MDNLWKYLILIGVLILFSRRKKGKAKDASAPPKPELEEPWSGWEMEMTTDDDRGSARTTPLANPPQISPVESSVESPYAASAARSVSSGTSVHSGTQTRQSALSEPVAPSLPHPILQAGDVDGMRRAFILSEIFHRKY